MPAITYETVFIAEPEISNDQVDQLIAKIKLAITANGGTLTGEDRWGRRRLAYNIQRHREGYYAILNFTAEAGAVMAIEHLYNVTDSVIRHLTTRVIKSKKTFRPRKERPAGYVEGARHSGRPVGASRGRSDAPAVAKPVTPPSGSLGGSAKDVVAGGASAPGAAADAPASAAPAPVAAPSQTPAPGTTTPEGGTPA